MNARWRGFLPFAINVFATGDLTIHDRKIGDRVLVGRR